MSTNRNRIRRQRSISWHAWAAEKAASIKDSLIDEISEDRPLSIDVEVTDDSQGPEFGDLRLLLPVRVPRSLLGITLDALSADPNCTISVRDTGSIAEKRLRYDN